MEPRELWARELPASMRDRGPRVERRRAKRRAELWTPLLARLNPDFGLVAGIFAARRRVTLHHPSVDKLFAAPRLAIDVHHDARLGAVGEVNESWAHDPRIGGAGLALEPGQRLGRGRRGLAVLPKDVVNAADW